MTQGLHFILILGIIINMDQEKYSLIIKATGSVKRQAVSAQHIISNKCNSKLTSILIYQHQLQLPEFLQINIYSLSTANKVDIPVYRVGVVPGASCPVSGGIPGLFDRVGGVFVGPALGASWELRDVIGTVVAGLRVAF